MGDEESLVRRVGATLDVPDAGCCVMAGAFGFDGEKYEVSQAIGERRLLPAIRDTPADTLIVADGFSCRERIRQGTGRNALHLADVLAGALRASATAGSDGRVRQA